MFYQLSITSDVLQIAYQAQLKEDYRVYRLLATPPVIGLGKFVEKIQMELLLQLAVKIMLRHVCRKREDQHLLIFQSLPTLHNLKKLVLLP